MGLRWVECGGLAVTAACLEVQAPLMMGPDESCPSVQAQFKCHILPYCSSSLPQSIPGLPSHPTSQPRHRESAHQRWWGDNLTVSACLRGFLGPVTNSVT